MFGSLEIQAVSRVFATAQKTPGKTGKTLISEKSADRRTVPLIRRFLKNSCFSGLLQSFLRFYKYSANSQKIGRLKYLGPEAEGKRRRRAGGTSGGTRRLNPTPPHAHLIQQGYIG